jgi:hypothetical protein
MEDLKANIEFIDSLIDKQTDIMTDAVKKIEELKRKKAVLQKLLDKITKPY